MDDKSLLELYLHHDPRAIDETLSAHGQACRCLAMNILGGEKEADTCVKEALEAAVTVMHAPDDLPADLGIHLQGITRAHAVSKYTASHSVKRGYSMFSTILDELSESLPLPDQGDETPVPGEDGQIRHVLNRFLSQKSRETRDIFICRYFFAESLGEISHRFGLHEDRVSSRLRRTCRRLASVMDSRDIPLTPVLLMTEMSYIDGALIASAHKGYKRGRRLVPWVAAACVIGALALSFPYLRQVINTDLVLRNPDWNKETDGMGEAETPHKPDEEAILGVGSFASTGGCSITLTAVTDTTLTLTLVKTDHTPLYAAFYDRLGDALACTDPSYKVDGVTIRPGRIKVYAEGATEPETELPTAPGNYTLTIDFTSVRNGTYPMEDYVGFFTYTGKDNTPVAVYFSLILPEEAETTEGEITID